MPDWSYHTLFKPILFRMPPEKARDATLRAMGLIAKLPGGSLLIKTLGHMEVSPKLAEQRWGIDLKYPVGLGGGLDVHGIGHAALARLRLHRGRSGHGATGRCRAADSYGWSRRIDNIPRLWSE